jgi:hypothetical protein
MKTVLQHNVSDISAVLMNSVPIFLNRNGNITECNGMFYNQTTIKLVPSNRSGPIELLSEDEVYYNK